MHACTQALSRREAEARARLQEVKARYQRQQEGNKVCELLWCLCVGCVHVGCVRAHTCARAAYVMS